MNRTKIPWVKNPDGSQGYTLNPISGCLNQVDGMCKGGGFPCYAYGLAQGRLFKRYIANNNYAPVFSDGKGIATDLVDTLDPFYPRFWPEKLKEFSELAYKPKGIFLCSMSDLFGIGIPEEWIRQVLDMVKYQFMHRFYLLTKQPQNLIKFSPFPDNCWVGASATRQTQFTTSGTAMWGLSQIKAKVKYLSFEPLLERISADGSLTLLGEKLVDWVIIGSCTGTKKAMLALIEENPSLTLMPFGNRWTAQPRIEWISQIVQACDRAGVTVFLKNNLIPLLSASPKPDKAEIFYSGMGLRQDLPNADS